MEAQASAPMKTLSVIGMGPSLSRYFDDFEAAGSKRPTDEVIGINSVIYWLSPAMLTRGLAADNFHRDMKMDGGKWQQYVHNMANAGIPIIADVAYPEWPHIEAFPIKEVVADIWPAAKSEAEIIPDLENSINWAVAWGIWKRFGEIRLYGCDFRGADNPYEMATVADKLEDIKPPWFAYHNPNIVKGRRDREPGEATTMFLLGIAHERKINILIATGSTLCNMDRGRYFYGYQEPPEIFPVNPLVDKLQRAADEYNKVLEEVQNATRTV